MGSWYSARFTVASFPPMEQISVTPITSILPCAHGHALPRWSYCWSRGIQRGKTIDNLPPQRSAQHFQGRVFLVSTNLISPCDMTDMFGIISNRVLPPSSSRGQARAMATAWMVWGSLGWFVGSPEWFAGSPGQFGGSQNGLQGLLDGLKGL